MAIAVVSVSILIALILGFPRSLIVFIAIPVTLALTLTVFYLYGYTLNRITLFALIFSIGILVDDAIVVVENIVRHARLPENLGRSLADVAIEAVDEVGNPTILATLTVIAAILPMAFVGGLMGPYMRPIPIGASAAMIFSIIVAFLVTPWAAVRILKKSGAHGHEHVEDRLTVAYRRYMDRLIHHPPSATSSSPASSSCCLGSMALVYVEFVKVKMLPFDNKSEFQVIVDMPEGTTLEETARVTRELAAAAFGEPEVVNVQTYAGTAAPYNFNGLVRHYFLRRGVQRGRHPGEPARQARSRPAKPRDRQEGAGPADPHRQAPRTRASRWPRCRPARPSCRRWWPRSTARPPKDRNQVAKDVLAIFDRTSGVVDADWYVEDPQPKLTWRVDREKAALNGVSTSDIAQTLSLAAGGMSAGLLHVEEAKEDVPITLRLDRATRSDLEQLKQPSRARPRRQSASRWPNSSASKQQTVEPSIYHKNLMPVTYVTADVAGAMESPVYAILKLGPGIAKIPCQGKRWLRHRAVHRPPAF